MYRVGQSCLPHGRWGPEDTVRKELRSQYPFKVTPSMNYCLPMPDSLKGSLPPLVSVPPATFSCKLQGIVCLPHQLLFLPPAHHSLSPNAQLTLDVLSHLPCFLLMGSVTEHGAFYLSRQLSSKPQTSFSLPPQLWDNRCVLPCPGVFM